MGWDWMVFIGHRFIGIVRAPSVLIIEAQRKALNARNARASKTRKYISYYTSISRWEGYVDGPVPTSWLHLTSVI